MSTTSPGQNKASPRIVRLIRGLAGFAFRLLPRVLLGGGSRHGPYPVEDLLERLIIPATDTDEDEEQSLLLKRKCDALLKARDWDGLASFLEALDLSREAVPSGKRHIEIALFHLRYNLSETARNPTNENFEIVFSYATQVVALLNAAHLARPESYAIAGLLARIHLDTIAMIGGTQQPPHAGRASETELEQHHNIIRELFTKFDPVAFNSPFLAELQYRLQVATHPQDLDRIGDAFDDWIELDPGNLTAYRTHAHYMLPNYSGDEKRLRQEAERAVELTRDAFGTGAYAAMYILALESHPSCCETLDAEMFLQSIDDIMVHMKSDPTRLTYVIQQCSAIFGNPKAPIWGQLSRGARRVAVEIRDGLPPIYRKHLTMLCSCAWEGPEIEFLQAVAPAFHDELSRGKTVELTEFGLSIR